MLFAKWAKKKSFYHIRYINQGFRHLLFRPLIWLLLWNRYALLRDLVRWMLEVNLDTHSTAKFPNSNRVTRTLLNSSARNFSIKTENFHFDCPPSFAKNRKVFTLIALDVSIAFSLSSPQKIHNTQLCHIWYAQTSLRHEKLQSFVEAFCLGCWGFLLLPVSAFDDASFTRWLTIPLGISFFRLFIKICWSFGSFIVIMERWIFASRFGWLGFCDAGFDGRVRVLFRTVETSHKIESNVYSKVE